MRFAPLLLPLALLLTGCPDPPPPVATPGPTSGLAGELPQPTGTIERIARPRSAPGRVAALSGPTPPPAGEELLLPDLTAFQAGLSEDKAPAPERVTRVVVTIDRNGATQVGEPEPDVPWLGLWLPKDGNVAGTPTIDLNERRVKLLYVDKDTGKPLKTPAANGQVRLKIGARRVETFVALNTIAAGWPPETAVILDAHVHVPIAQVVTALGVLVSQGLSPQLAAPDVAYAAGGIRPLEAVTRQGIADAAKEAPKDPSGLPKLGVRIRADARARWSHACSVFSAAVQARVRRVTLCGNAGEFEIDLFAHTLPPDANLAQGYDPALPTRAPVEKPIIVLEEEVEVTKGIPKGTDRGTLGGARGAVNDLPHGGRYDKTALVREGGSQETEAAVARALRWLEGQQRSDGSWSAGQGAKHLDPGLTALVLLAYTGTGATHRYGVWKRSIRKAMRWLKAQQTAEGSFGFKADQVDAQRLVGHALATEALCELYALTRDLFLKRHSLEAAQYAALGHAPKLKLDPKQVDDVTVVATLLRALRAARLAKVPVPIEGEKTLLAWLEAAPAVAPAAWAERLARGAAPSALGANAKTLKTFVPHTAHDRLAVTEALFYRGGAPWKTWSKRSQQSLLSKQDAKTGTWPATGEEFMEGSQVAVTALNALALETYYRITRPTPKK